jgi:L-ascorbate metabolism protein UlaG (beta-lactamase superfamily)
MTYWLTAITVVLVLVIFLIFDGWRSFGKQASMDRRQAFDADAVSAEFRSGKFRNELPLKNYMWRAVRDGITSRNHKYPDGEIETYSNDGGIYSSPPEGNFRVTWLGHSTLLIELDGVNLLIDPVWGERASPFSWLGPKRWFDPPLAIENLPRIDAVLISHDHYDHLDRPTIEALGDTMFIVPLGVGSHLRYWGVPESSITEVDWWQKIEIAGVAVIATPARHASGRHLLDNDTTLWAGYAMLGSQRLYYSGDTGLFPGFKEIGERLGPFDLTMIEVGAYSRNWPDWHLGPEQAVIANQWVKGKRLLPLHWGLFNLAEHNWTEPMERVLAAAGNVNLTVVTPMAGQPFVPGVSTFEKWWPDLPWQGPDEHAVMSTRLTSLDENETRLINGQ